VTPNLVRDYGLQAGADDIVLKSSDEENRILISADTDFGTLLAFIRDRLRRTQYSPKLL
jgi:predicted nuclease of predicted toxin-antitoxin system